MNTLIVSEEVLENSLNSILKLKLDENHIQSNEGDDFISILIFLPDLRSILDIKNKLSSKFSDYIERGMLKIFELNSTLDVMF